MALPRFLLCAHLYVHILHPEQQVTDHVEEAVEVAGITQTVLASVDVDL